MLKEQIPLWVRPDATAESKRRLNEAANFFKYAERDHDEVLEFSTDPTSCCYGLSGSRWVAYGTRGVVLSPWRAV